jgi:hypothetical protein
MPVYRIFPASCLAERIHAALPDGCAGLHVLARISRQLPQQSDRLTRISGTESVIAMPRHRLCINTRKAAAQKVCPRMVQYTGEGMYVAD